MKTLKCHCGAFEAKINFTGKFEKILRCNCSFMQKKGRNNDHGAKLRF